MAVSHGNHACGLPAWPMLGKSGAPARAQPNALGKPCYSNAPGVGLEPTTFGLTARRSAELSYPGKSGHTGAGNTDLPGQV